MTSLEAEEMLRCDECSTTTADGVGWRAFSIADDAEENEPAEVTIYCPACARREFGDARRARE